MPVGAASEACCQADSLAKSDQSEWTASLDKCLVHSGLTRKHVAFLSPVAAMEAPNHREFHLRGALYDRKRPSSLPRVEDVGVASYVTGWEGLPPRE